MKQYAKNILIVFVVICLLAVIYWFYREGQTKKTETAGILKASKGPVVLVNAVPIKKSTVNAVISVYGEVVPAPGAIQVVSVPYESQVLRVMVSDAQKISKRDVLLEIGLSPDTKLLIQQAQNDYQISEQSLKHVQQLFDLKLATNNQLLLAEQAFQKAELSLKSLKQRGISGSGTRVIHAGVTGLVNKVYVKEGAIVPAGNPLVEVVPKNRLEVRLELEPQDSSRLHAGQSVLLSYVNVPASKAVNGRVRKISRAVNLASRLVDVFVTLPDSARFLLGEYILGRITIASSYGLVVPRSAILSEEGNYILFTIKEGHALKHLVQVSLENSNEALVSVADLRPGELVVVLGNYELKDGMAVRMESNQ
jgi:membrane fusion protein (multidrug efflux system)